ncbi:PD40 domain-containing protein [candidate division KSB1 bacterium]|nr:PD40 domain-containing protein [candidate division KSB1 bacterium]
MLKKRQLVWAGIWLLISGAHAQVGPAGQPMILMGGDDQICINPQFSPDGRYIAFSSANYRGIRVMEWENGTVRVISDEDAAGFGYAWSPDSRSILTRTARFENYRRYNAVKFFNVESGQETVLQDYTTASLSLPQFDRSGTRVAFYAKNRFRSEQIAEQTAELQKSVPDHPVPLMQGDRIVLWYPAEERLEPLSLPMGDQFLNPAVSPNGRLLVFEVYGGNLVVYDLHSKTWADLGVGYHPAWSPNSRYVVFTLALDDGHNLTSADLYIVDVESRDRMQLTDTPDLLEMNATWSPDGSTVVCDEADQGVLIAIPVQIEE